MSSSTRSEFALVLLDIEMPELSGLEVLEEPPPNGIRRRELPVIMVTARQQSESVVEALSWARTTT